MLKAMCSNNEKVNYCTRSRRGDPRLRRYAVTAVVRAEPPQTASEDTEAKCDVCVKGGTRREERVIFIVVKAARILGGALDRTRFCAPPLSHYCKAAGAVQRVHTSQLLQQQSVCLEMYM